MNRWLLFGFDQYYPSGGMDDCVLMSNDASEILERWKMLDYNHSHVYDCVSGRQYNELEIFDQTFA